MAQRALRVGVIQARHICGAALIAAAGCPDRPLGRYDDGGNPGCDGSPCGGSIVGAWCVVASCTDLPFAESVCDLASTVSIALQRDVTWTFDEDGDFRSEGSGTVDVVGVFPPPCVDGPDCESFASTLGDLGAEGLRVVATCSAAPSGGCECAITMSAPVAVAGRWSPSGSFVTLDSEGASVQAEYCARGTTLWMRTPYGPFSFWEASRRLGAEETDR